MIARRRTRVRLGLRDLAAAAAFGSMALSGELPVWALGLFCAALVTALAGLRPLGRIPVASGVLLAAAAVALYATVAAGGLDLVVAACAFAALITAQRMLSGPGTRTDHQVLLTSLLMISGGAALSGDLLFAVALALFATLACFALLLGVLEAAGARELEVQLAPAARATAVGMAAAMIGATLLFALFPRLSWNVAGRRSSRGFGATTGLNESGVRLTGGGGTIKTNPRVVARVELSPDPKGERLDAYFLAGTFGTFTGQGWEDDREAEGPAYRVVVREAPGAREQLVRQRFDLLPAYGAQTAIALVEPVMFGGAKTQVQTVYGQTRLLRRPGQDVRFEQRADAYAYNAFSAQRPEALPPADPLEDAERARYLALPADLDPRIAGMAAEAAGAERDPLAAARRMERWLRQGYAYTLDLPEAGDDPLATFLFDRRAGHCEYFASALAVLLRARGIPARVATGFYGGERAGEGPSYLIRAGDAHAWTQAWIDGRGFVNLDATPEQGRAARPQPLLGWLLRQYERIEEVWRNSVLEYSLRDQARLVTGAFTRDEGGIRRARLPWTGRSGWIAAAALALVAYGVWRARLLRRTRAPAHAGTALREEAEALLRRHQLGPRAGEGFEDLARRLSQQGHPAAGAVQEVVEAWRRARFGGGDLPLPVRRALVARLRAALGDAKLRRAA